MTKKIAKKKITPKPQPMTLKMFPDRGVLGLFMDFAMVALLVSASMMMTVSAVMMAGKITIIAGK